MPAYGLACDAGVTMLGAWNDARMNTKGIFRFLLAAALLWLMAAPLVRAQEAPPTAPEVPSAQEKPPPAEQPQPPSQQEQPPELAPGNTRFSLSDTISVTLAPEWRLVNPGQARPPEGLGGYAPPFHLSGLLALANSDEGSILQLATSDNPLLGHDPYWLDTQMHSPSGSGMSLPDFLFYFFLPPSVSCMDQVSHNLANASRVSANDASSPSALQVFYACPLGETLADFYASQVSAGITFRQGTTGGSHASGAFSEFYVAPMEQVDTGSMTFFVFEAQELGGVTPDAATHFNLPDALQGATADFFWAIGAPNPFPFAASASPEASSTPLVHVAFASTVVGRNKRDEFVELLHQVQTR
jgi:hypothetical protein